MGRRPKVVRRMTLWLRGTGTENSAREAERSTLLLFDFEIHGDVFTAVKTRNGMS